MLKPMESDRISLEEIMNSPYLRQSELTKESILNNAEGIESLLGRLLEEARANAIYTRNIQSEFDLGLFVKDKVRDSSRSTTPTKDMKEIPLDMKLEAKILEIEMDKLLMKQTNIERCFNVVLYERNKIGLLNYVLLDKIYPEAKRLGIDNNSDWFLERFYTLFVYLHKRVEILIQILQDKTCVHFLEVTDIWPEFVDDVRNFKIIENLEENLDILKMILKGLRTQLGSVKLDVSGIDNLEFIEIKMKSRDILIEFFDRVKQSFSSRKTALSLCALQAADYLSLIKDPLKESISIDANKNFYRDFNKFYSEREAGSREEFLKRIFVAYDIK
jgi:hypothetical protein